MSFRSLLPIAALCALAVVAMFVPARTQAAIEAIKAG